MAPPEVQAGPRPLLALDAARDRLYVLALDLEGRGTEVAALRGSDLRVEESRTDRSEPWASLAIAPDGALLYLATPPRRAVGAVGPRVAVEVLDAVGLGRRLYAGLLLPGAWDSRRPLIAR